MRTSQNPNTAHGYYTCVRPAETYINKESLATNYHLVALSVAINAGIVSIYCQNTEEKSALTTPSMVI